MADEPLKPVKSAEDAEGAQGSHDAHDAQNSRAGRRTLSSSSTERPRNLRGSHSDEPTPIKRSNTTRVGRQEWESLGGSAGARRLRGNTTGALPPRFSQDLGPIRRRSTARTNMTKVASAAVSSGRAPSIPGGFSLAGLAETIAARNHNEAYVDPGYAELNPAYAQPVNTRPVWGLAKPLPRVVRPGMVPSSSELDLLNLNNQNNAPNQNQQDNGDHTDIDLEKGRVQPTLQLGKISSALDTAREQRESRVIERYGSRSGGSAPFTRPSRLGSTSLTPHEEDPEQEAEAEAEEEAEAGEADLAQGRPQLQPEQHPESYDGTSPFPTLDDDASQAPTEHDDEWLDTIPLAPYGPEDEVHNFHTQWSVIRAKFREPLAEFLAALVQLTLGFCIDLAALVSRGSFGNETTIGLGWGFAGMTGIYIAGGISGAHLNPAISIMLYVYRGFPLRKVPGYMLAQVLAAFCAALIAYGIFRVDILQYGGAELGSGGSENSFITNPRYTWIDPATGFFTEFTGTAILAVAVLAIGDDTNAPPGAGMSAFIMGLIITLLTWTFGYNTGAALNPSRDIGPRFALLALGYGGQVFRNAWWVYGPWVATITGAIFGGFLYDFFIFVGGESPVNYPRKRMKRAGRKWKRRWGARLKRIKKRYKDNDDASEMGDMEKKQVGSL